MLCSLGGQVANTRYTTRTEHDIVTVLRAARDKLGYAQDIIETVHMA